MHALLIYFSYASYGDILILSWYFDILRFWYNHDMIMILSNDCWYIFHMPAYSDILIFWYYHDTIFIFSNDGWYIFRMPVYGDILIFWDFDIIMIIIWYYQMIVDRIFALHFMVIFWYYRDILILANSCKHVSRMPSQIRIFILSWCFKIIVLSWYFKIIKIKTIIITNMCCLVL